MISNIRRIGSALLCDPRIDLSQGYVNIEYEISNLDPYREHELLFIRSVGAHKISWHIWLNDIHDDGDTIKCVKYIDGHQQGIVINLGQNCENGKSIQEFIDEIVSTILHNNMTTFISENDIIRNTNGGN